MIVRASPNIAFIKYWGKKQSSSWENNNLALNPSLSMTLSCAESRVEITTKKSGSSQLWMKGQRAQPQEEIRVVSHLENICRSFKLPPPIFEIHSENNFPQSTGLASSASAFAALTLACLVEILGEKEARLYLKEKNFEYSVLARRGSGSACRSVAGGFMLWEEQGARSLPLKWDLKDSILIFSKEAKKVSSSEGHKSAQSSPLFQERLLKIPERLSQLNKALQEKNLKNLGPLLEEEALEMHAIAETGTPPINYKSQLTEKFIRALQVMPERDFFFTLDAGPNIHLISERDISKDIKDLLKTLNIKAEIFLDSCGEGPRLS